MTSTHEKDLHLRALMGHAPSMYALGIGYLTGAFGVEKETEATIWLWQAQQSGYELADWVLNTLSEKGLELTPPPALEPVEPSNEADPIAEKTLSAAALYARVENAAQQGDGMAMTILGYYLETGFIARPDATAALAWYKQASATNNLFGTTEYARCLMRGIGTDAKPEEAIKLFLNAAYQGHDAAAFHAAIGMLGKHLPSDPALTFQLIRYLASRKHPGAYATLTYLYAMGYGTPMDTQKAHDMIIGMFKSGQPWSIPEELGVNTRQFCVKMGAYFESNNKLPLAWLWFSLLPENDSYKRHKLFDLEERMTPGQRQDLKELQREIQASSR